MFKYPIGAEIETTINGFSTVAKLFQKSPPDENR